MTLALRRRVGQAIHIGPDIVIRIDRIDRCDVRLAIDAPGMRVDRAEVREQHDRPSSKEALVEAVRDELAAVREQLQTLHARLVELERLEAPRPKRLS